MQAQRPVLVSLVSVPLTLPHAVLRICITHSHFLCKAVAIEDACALFVSAGAAYSNDATENGRGTLQIALFCEFVANQL